MEWLEYHLRLLTYMVAGIDWCLGCHHVAPADPVFVRSFKVLYNFERVAEYRVLIVDVDSGQDHAHIPPEDCVSGNHWLVSPWLPCRC